MLEAYDAGETSFAGQPLFGPNEGRGPFSGGNYISRPRTGATNQYVSNANGSKTYGYGKGNTPFAPMPKVADAFNPNAGGGNKVIS